MQDQMSQVPVAAPSKQQVILPTSSQKVQTCSQGEQQPLWRRGGVSITEGRATQSMDTASKFSDKGLVSKKTTQTP